MTTLKLKNFLFMGSSNNTPINTINLPNNNSFSEENSDPGSSPSSPLVLPSVSPSISPSSFSLGSLRSLSPLSFFKSKKSTPKNSTPKNSTPKNSTPKNSTPKNSINYSSHNSALNNPSNYAKLLLNTAQLNRILGNDNKQLIDNNMINIILSLMTPDLVRLALKNRNSTYLLGLAQSSCTKEWIKSNEKYITRIKDSLKSANLNVKNAANNQLNTFCISIAKMLLDGVDILNWDNLKWPIPEDIVFSTQEEKIKYIIDNNLTPLNIKNNSTAKQRFPKCSEYLRAHSSILKGGRNKNRKTIKRRRKLRY